MGSVGSTLGMLGSASALTGVGGAALMASPIGSIITENHGQQDECNIQVVLVVDLLEDKRGYRWDCYDPAGNMLERVGYTHGNVVVADGSVKKGDRIRPLGLKQEKRLEGYLKEIGVENDTN